MSKLSEGSLFAGVGGFGAGFRKAGYDTKWVVEWDKHCQTVLRRQFPEARLYSDVTEVSGDELGYVDVVTYGFPCQDVSVAGKRKGVKKDETRSGLFYDAMRIIRSVKPRVCIFENVPGLLSSGGGNDFAEVIRELTESGYGNTLWVTLDSQWFGVAQRRRRVFGISSREAEGDFAKRCAEKILSLSQGLCGDSEESGEEGEGASRDVAPSLTASNDPSRSPQSSEVTRQVEAVVRATGEGFTASMHDITPALQARDYKDINSDGLDKNSAKLIPEVCGCLSDGAHHGGGLNGQDAYTGRVIPVADKSFCLQGGGHTSQQSQGSGVNEDVSFTLNNIDKHAVVYDNHPADAVVGEACIPIDVRNATRTTEKSDMNRQGVGFGKDGDPSPTLTDVFTPAVATSMQVRRLTPVECCRLQSFSDDWNEWGLDAEGNKVILADSHRYKQMGNAVTVNVAEWLANLVKEQLKEAT